MRKSKLPKTDSIQKLAEFWDTHDLTELEGELEVVSQPVFARKKGAAIRVPLDSGQAKTVKRMARAKGVSTEELVRGWVVQKIGRQGS